MYYWDTYFTNHGLILRGDLTQAKNNVENMFFLVERLGFCPQEERETLMRGMYASGESGWDLNPRMSYKTFQYNAVDLNSLIFALEDTLSFFYCEIGNF